MFIKLVQIGTVD